VLDLVFPVQLTDDQLAVHQTAHSTSAHLLSPLEPPDDGCVLRDVVGGPIREAFSKLYQHATVRI
jgi:hypothetical protein